MDAGPNISIAEPATAASRRSSRRARCCCCGTSQSDLLNASDRRHLSCASSRERLAPARARAQHRTERDLEHDVAAIAAADSRADYVAFSRAGEGGRPAGHARSVVRCAQRAGRLDLPVDRSRGERSRRCCSRPSGWPRTPAPLTMAERDGAAPLIGSSETMRLLRERVERVANTNFTVLIEGESGVGKELRGAADPRARSAAAGAIRRDQLRGAGRDADRSGAVRHRGADRHRRARGGAASSSTPTAARCFSTRSRICPRPRRRSLLRVIQDLTVERVGGIGPRQINTRIVAATNRPLSGSSIAGCSAPTCSIG